MALSPHASYRVLTISFGFGGFFAANVLTPLWLQSYMRYTSTWAGLATAWTGLLAIFMAPIAGMLMTKVDPRRLVCFGMFATSIATTAWESNTSVAHAQLAGEIDRSGEAARSLLGSGMDMDSVRSVLDGMTQGQSVMLATNEIMATCALAVCVAALLIWLAPRTARVVDMSKVGH